MKTPNRSEDVRYMARALALAAGGEGKTAWRPLVGCVLVKNGRVIAEAGPVETGVPHVEAQALKKAGKQATGATVYVNLEPCSWHKDKQAPACCEELVRAKVARVVCAMADPHPAINGRGIDFLKKKGMAVESGICRDEAAKLNEAWTKYMTTGKPLVVLKMAVTLDGKIWSSKTPAVSNEEERAFTHRLRNRYQAILVGAGTIAQDNPRLTCRMPGGRNPLRVIIDSRLRSPEDANVFADSNSVVFSSAGVSQEKVSQLGKKNISVIPAGKTGGRVELKKVLEELGKRKISSVLVEGGSEIATAFLNARLVDKIIIAVAPKLFGPGVPIVRDSLESIVQLDRVRITVMGDNVVFEGYPCYGERGESNRSRKSINRKKRQ